MKEDLSKHSVKALLLQHVEIIEELKKRRILRSNNTPTADYAEWLVSKAFDLKIQSKSKKGYDAIDSKGNRYQIKGRKITPENSSRQLGVIRNLEAKHFDFLIGIIFDKDFSVLEAYKIPHSIISKYSSYSKHQNGEILHLKGELVSARGVERIDEQMRRDSTDQKIFEKRGSPNVETLQKGDKDFSKYLFNGEKYPKRRLVLAIVEYYLKVNPKTTFENLIRAFPDKLQGNSRGVVRKKEAIKDPKRYFVESPLTTVDGVEVVICGEWGAVEEKFNTSRQDINNFIDYVGNSLGYKIERIEK